MAAPVHSSTQAAPHGGAGGGFPPFQTHTFGSQLLWLAITFGLLYVLMSRVALPRVASILADRGKKIEADLAEAAKLKSQSDDAIAAYEKSLADAKAKAQTIAAETHAKLAAETETRRKALEADLAEKLTASDKALAARKAEAMKNVRGIAIEATGDIVAKLTGKAPAKGEIEAAIGQA